MLKAAPIKVSIVGEDRLSKDLANAEKRAKKFAQGLSKVGSKLTTYVSAPLIAAGGASIKFAMDLNKSMANIATLIPKNRKRVEELKDEIQDLSVRMGISSDDLSASMYDIISAFGDSNEAMDQLTIASTASIAGLSSTKEAVDFLSATTKGWGDTSAKAMQQASDLAFTTIKLGKTNFPELAASMGKVIPIADALGNSKENLFGAMATLTGVTGNTNEVVTQLQSVFTAMVKPTTDMTKAVNAMGYESASAMIKQVKMRHALIRIGAASAGIDKVKKAVNELGFASVKAMDEQLGFEESSKKLNETLMKNDDNLAKMFGRKEALVAVMSLLGGQSDTFKEKTEAMNKVLGATIEAYKEQDEGINKTGRSWDKTKAHMMRFAQKIGDRLLPIMERLFDKIKPWLTKLEKVDEKTLEWGIKIAGVAVAAGPLILALGKMSTGFLALIRLGGKTGALAGTASSIAGIGAAAQEARGKVSRLGKLLSTLGKAGFVAETAAVGYGLGTLVSEALIQPREEEKFTEEEKIFRRRARAERMITGEANIEQRLSMVKQLQDDMDNLAEVMTSFGGDLQGIVGTFTGAETVIDRHDREWQKIYDTRKRLMESVEAERKQLVKEGIFTPRKGEEGLVERKAEKTVNINFKADIPGTVQLQETERRLTPAETGAIMEGL